jgi:pimeloyl-ACP methyl ester carboxylesterase
MPFADVNGQRIHYSDSGGDGPAVVFSHGFFMDHTMWAPQIEELRPTYRAVAIDARGFGLTEFDEKPFTYWDLASDLFGVMDAAGLDAAILVGLSQGGFTIQRAALLAPTRVRGLVLIDTNASVETDDTKATARATRDALLTSGWSDEFARGMAAMVFAPGYEASDWIGRWQQNPPRRIAPAFDNLIERDAVEDRLGEISCPALVLHGELDAVMPVDHAKDLCARLTGCEGVVVIPAAGHTANLENHAAVNEALRDFVVRHGN